MSAIVELWSLFPPRTLACLAFASVVGATACWVLCKWEDFK